MIDQIQNGEIGSSVRSKLNQTIDIANYSGTQLLASGSVDLNTSADQPITLLGGTKFVVTDVVMTNASGTFNSASYGPYLYTAPSQSGDMITCGTYNNMTIPDHNPFTPLFQSPNNYVSNIGFLNNSYWSDAVGIVLPTQVTVGNTLYFSVTSNESPSTADMYIYGYILA